MLPLAEVVEVMGPESRLRIDTPWCWVAARTQRSSAAGDVTVVFAEKDGGAVRALRVALKMFEA
jgi:hypothetical protein